jgi:alcohol dehydrogenase class IV
MVETFNFGRIPDIYFGVGKFSLLPDLIKEFGKRILIVTGEASFLSSSFWEELRELFELHELEWAFTQIPKEPTAQMINDITTYYKFAGIQVILAIGGGSVIDASKAIAAMMPFPDENVEDYLEDFGEKIHTGRSLPMMAVPTTSGTGAETTRFGLLSEVGKRGEKKMLRHSRFVPKVAVVDPRLMKSCPPDLTAATGMNAFSQLLESYLSLGANQLTDSLAFKGISYVCKCLPRAFKSSGNIKAREGMAYASMMSGVTSSNTGMGSVNGLALAISGKFDIPFSTICATLMGEVNRANIVEIKKYYETNISLDKYTRVGKLLVKKRRKSDAYYKDLLIDKIMEWTEHFQIPKLSTFGITSEDLQDIVNYTQLQNNPIPLMEEQLLDILEKRL